MESFKGRFENVFQKVNSAGRNLLSTLMPENTEVKLLEDSKEFTIRERFFSSKCDETNDENDPCLECEQNFGILSIADDEIRNINQSERQNDREEIRKKLAMDSDNEDYVAEKMVQNQESKSVDRLKGGNNLQICFMNEAAKETDVISEVESAPEIITTTETVKKPLPKLLMNSLLFPPNPQKTIGQNNNSQPQVIKRQRPNFFFNRPRSWHAPKVEEKLDPEEDLFTRHNKLQAEAWEALAQAKDMARMQMEIERQKKKKSPIADIVGITFPDGKNNLSRNALLDMNVAQLQVIVNDLHSQIETLNENLVKFLLERDDLHMEQDSMLVDIEDLTRYLGLKGANSQSTDSKLALNMPITSSHTKSLLSSV